MFFAVSIIQGFFQQATSKCKFTTWKRPKNLSGRNIVKIKDLFQKSHENFPKNKKKVFSE